MSMEPEAVRTPVSATLPDAQADNSKQQPASSSMSQLIPSLHTASSSSAHVSVSPQSLQLSRGRILRSHTACASRPEASAGQTLAAGSARPPDVPDALRFLDDVKAQLMNQPDKYNCFVGIMKDFNMGQIDMYGVIERVSAIFSGHPRLILGFSTFLPAGCQMGCHGNTVVLTTPDGTFVTFPSPAARNAQHNAD